MLFVKHCTFSAYESFHCIATSTIMPSFSPTAWKIFGCSTVFAAVHVLDEALDAAGVREVLALAVALVDQLDLRAVVEERELADALGQDLVVVLDVVEGLREAMKCTSVPRRSVDPDDRERRHGHAARNSIWCILPSRQILSFSQSDSAFTTDTPTPCRPPETL